MVERIAFVDEVALAREFATDDHVRKVTHRDALCSPYVGRVLYADNQTGKVMVQWPWGPEHEQPSELIRDASEMFRPPLQLDQLPQTVERQQHSNSDADFKADEKYRKSLAGTVAQRAAQIYEYERRIRRIAQEYEKRTLPIKRAVCLAFHSGKSEVDAYLAVGAEFVPSFGTEPVRLTVSNFYETARRLAIYWKDNNRRYKVTQRERAVGQLKCPRCASPLKPKTYRQGKKIFNCGSCGFSISPKDLIT
jgi:hypothetical protein